MAFTGPPRPLECAERVLKPETLRAFNESPSFNRFGTNILDRWALNQPEELKSLERKSETLLLITLLTQQTKEKKLHDRPETLEQLANGLMFHEIMEMNGLDGRLIPYCAPF